MECEVASTPAEQARGLQDHPPLSPGQGMLFPFLPPRSATFHMGRVAFPIDLVFLDPDGVARRVVTAAPGTRARWSHDPCLAVLEVAGGFCARVGFGPGETARFLPRYAAIDGLTYDEPDVSRHRELTDDINHVDPEDRFRDRALIDDAAPQAISDEVLEDAPGPFSGWPEGSSAYWEGNNGYSQIVPELREMRDLPEPALRPLASAFLTRRAQQLIQDPGAFVAGMVEGMTRDAQHGGGLHWQPEVLTLGHVESARVTPADISRWLDRLNVVNKPAILRAATTQEGLRTLADGLILAGTANVTRVSGDSVILWRSVESPLEKLAHETAVARQRRQRRKE